MKYRKTIEARLLSRPNRFIAKVDINGHIILLYSIAKIGKIAAYLIRQTSGYRFLA